MRPQGAAWCKAQLPGLAAASTRTERCSDSRIQGPSEQARGG